MVLVAFAEIDHLKLFCGLCADWPEVLDSIAMGAPRCQRGGRHATGSHVRSRDFRAAWIKAADEASIDPHLRDGY